MEGVLNPVLAQHRGRCGLPLHLVGPQLPVGGAPEVLPFKVTGAGAPDVAVPTILEWATVVPVGTIAMGLPGGTRPTVVLPAISWLAALAGE